EETIGEKLKGKAAAVEGVSEADVRRTIRDSVQVLMMIRGYRTRGHLHANLDPLGLAPRMEHEDLHASTYGFADTDLDRRLLIDGALGLEFARVNEILAILRRTYCATIGYEFMHISDPVQKAWMQERVEGLKREIVLSREDKRAILTKLVEVKGYERYLD